MSVSVSEILAGASVHAVPLAGECAGYLVLAAADQAATAPRRVGPDAVRLFEDGSVRVDGSEAVGEADSERDLRALLDALLLQASSATPGLLRASRRPAGRGLAAFVREIETALIPVNRAAAHRALARLERETERARAAGKLASAKLDTVPPAPLRLEGAPPAPAAGVLLEPEPAALLDPEPQGADADIPSLFAPPVEPSVAAADSAVLPPAEAETRPEPVVLRRSAPPPADETSVSLPPVAESEPSAFAELSASSLRAHEVTEVAIVETNASLPPVAESEPRTPVLGTFVQGPADDEVEIEIEIDEALLEDELTLVLERSSPVDAAAVDVEPFAGTSERTQPLPAALADASRASSDLAAPDAHSETMALALGPPQPAPEPPRPKLEMPKPKQSDVEDLLERMTQGAQGDGDIRASLKGLAGLEPTPPPPKS